MSDVKIDNKSLIGVDLSDWKINHRVQHDAVAKLMQDIATKREEIKTEYTKAWMAHNVPDSELTPENFYKKFQLVETWRHRGVTMAQ